MVAKVTESARDAGAKKGGTGQNDGAGKRKVTETGRRVMLGTPIETGVHPHTKQQMRTTSVWFVVGYLLVAFLAAAWTLWTLWTAGAAQPDAGGAVTDSVLLAWKPPLGSETTPLTAEARLILVVFLIGGLGGTIASFNSLANYRGEGALTKSWSLHYVVSPWLGAGVALLTYLVLRAGFFPGTSDQLEGIGIPWGVVAIAGLAGLFYDKSLLKLQQVFVTVFNPQDNRGAKLGDLAITTTSLPAAKAGEPYSADLKARGGQGEYTWSVTPELPDGLSLDPGTGKIRGTPTAPTESRPYTFSVSDRNGTAAESKLELEVASA